MVPVLPHRSLWSGVDVHAAQLLHLAELAELARGQQTHPARSGPTASGLGHKPLTDRHVALLRPADSSAERELEGAVREAGGQLAVLDAAAWLHAAQGRLSESARVLGRLYQWVDCVGLDAATLAAIERDAGVPVTDGLAHSEHPLYLLADFLAMREAAGAPLEDVHVVLAGDPTRRLHAAAQAMADQLGVVRAATIHTLPPPAETADRTDAPSNPADFVLDTDRAAAQGRLQAVDGGAVEAAALSRLAAMWRRSLLAAAVRGLAV
jgi:ornithine carbamoyltransferase